MLDAFFGVLFDIVLTGIFYWPGWVILRVASLGQYPPPRGQPHNIFFVAGVGLVSIVLFVTIAFS